MLAERRKLTTNPLTSTEGVALQVHKWFAAIPETGKQLCTALKESGKERIQDLVKNPLRLTLLCLNWQSGDGKLPDTQAGLYQQFVDDFYKWKKDEFATNSYQRQQLNVKLGELAKEAIDKEATRFRLRQDFVSHFLGDADDENSLLKLALNRGWLNCVGIDTNRKPVYAFFHASFQEYFAAKAIDHWQFFLNHVPKNPSQGTYRIFEPQWKQPFLFWLGHQELAKEQKQELIRALIKFRDRCGVWFFQDKVNKGFYEYRAYFLAAAGIAEFKDYSRGNIIVAQIVKWTIDGLPSIKEQARSTLEQTDRTKAINALVQVLHSKDVFEISRCQVAESLGQIDPGNKNAIAILVQQLHSTDKYYEIIRWQAAKSLGKIGTGNKKAIDALAKLLQSIDIHQDIRIQAAKSLGQIDRGNKNAIAALVELLQSTYLHKDIRMRAAHSLQEIGTGNKNVILVLAHLLLSTDLDKDTRWLAAYSLQEIGVDNENVIVALMQLLQSTDLDEDTRWLAAYSLQEIGTDNKNVIVALMRLLQSTDLDKYTHWIATYSLAKITTNKENQIVALVQLLELKGMNKDIRRLVAENLGQIDPGNPQAITVLAQLLQSTNLDDDTRWQTASSLGEIDPGNEIAIAALVQLLQSTNLDDDTRWQTASRLGEIGTGNEIAIAALVQLLQLTNLDNFTRRQAAESLGKIIQNNQHRFAVVKTLSGYWRLDDDYCYLAWKCAQNMPYPDFYQAWHQHNVATRAMQSLKKILFTRII